jgi:uncharacterized protein (TIGR02996 family)
VDEYHPFNDGRVVGAVHEYYGTIEGHFGRHGEFFSRVDLGKAMCRYAASMANYRRPGGDAGILFQDYEDELPPEEASLWVYGTPGQRYFAQWIANAFRPNHGNLQIDLSTPGPYTPDDLDVTRHSFTAVGNQTFDMRAYSREAMLATKVSWLMRSLARTDAGLSWTGQPKDLFDAHLLATDPTLRPEVFQRALLAFGASDQLQWNSLENLFAVRWSAISDAFFANWPEFQEQYPTLAIPSPTTLWAELAERLEPLLGDVYPAEEIPLLKSINGNVADELPMLVYADWLDERSDPRGAVVRAIAQMQFDPPPRDPVAVQVFREFLRSGTHRGWLHQLFGTSQELQAFLLTEDWRQSWHANGE